MEAEELFRITANKTNANQPHLGKEIHGFFSPFKEETKALVNYTGKYLPMPAALSAGGTRRQLETILLRWGSVIRNWGKQLDPDLFKMSPFPMNSSG